MSESSSQPSVGGGGAIVVSVGPPLLIGVTATGAPVRAPLTAPMRKLTTSLLSTYKLINTKYYAAKKERAARAATAAKGESAVADYAVVVGDMLGGRYRVIESLGKGSFGQVVSAEDTQDKNLTRVAVKVIKARDAFRRQAKTETKLLEKLNQQDPDDQWCIGERKRREGGYACLVTGAWG
jgi:hypothetical protein